MPVLAVLAAIALGRLASRLHRHAREPRLLAVAGLVAVLGLAVETNRWLRPPAVAIEGRPITHEDPIPPVEHRDRRVEVR